MSIEKRRFQSQSQCGFPGKINIQIKKKKIKKVHHQVHSFKNSFISNGFYMFQQIQSRAAVIGCCSCLQPGNA